jgi:hypothetical protein
MKTVERIIGSVREKGQPIGPKFFLHDRQLKEWAARHPEQAAILSQTRTPKAVSRAKKSKKEQVQPVKQLTVQELQAAKERMVSRLKNANTSVIDQAILRAKYEAQEKKKLADQVASNCRLSHIKSVGNGL